jgi:hypothetical protein
MMKKVLIGLVVLIVIVAGGVFYVFSNLDDLVKTAIETAGSDAVGTSVQVGSVEIDLMGGTASIFDFSVANPPGYSNQELMSFSELSLSLDINNLSGELIGIRSIVARDPYILYESIDDVSNLDTISANLAGDAPAESNESAGGPALVIDNILIENIQATLESELLRNPLEVNLGDISLENLEGSPDEIASQIMGPVISQISANAAGALLSAIANVDLEGLGEAAIEQVGEGLEQLEDTANDVLDGVLGEDVREGLGNLLR